MNPEVFLRKKNITFHIFQRHISLVKVLAHKVSLTLTSRVIFPFYFDSGQTYTSAQIFLWELRQLSGPGGPPVKLCCDSPFPRKTWPAGTFHFSLELRAVAAVVASEVGLLIPTEGGG